MNVNVILVFYCHYFHITWSVCSKGHISETMQFAVKKETCLHNFLEKILYSLIYATDVLKKTHMMKSHKLNMTSS